MREASGDGFTSADYVFYVLQSMEVAPDFLTALVDLLAPEIEEIEGRALVKAIGAVSLYRKYRGEGQSPLKAQYWANLTDISGLFEKADERQVRVLATAIAYGWNSQTDENLKARQIARVVIDHAEVFVTLDEVTAP
jgi:hypothetical protein